MSTEADFWPLFSEDPDANKQDLSFESFAKDIGEIELDWSFQQFQDNLSNFRDTLPVITTPSSLTYSTETDSEFALSQYSYRFAPSDYSIPSEIATRSPEEHGVYAIHAALCSDVAYDDPLSFGPLPPSPPLHPAKAYTDYGTSDPSRSFLDISPEEPSLALQQSTSIVVPVLQSVRAMPDSQKQVKPAKPFRCPQCSFAFKRSSNLKIHILTHDKEKSRRFPCHICHSRFTREHDLKRHRRKFHKDLQSSSSTDSGSAVASGPAAGVPGGSLVYFQGDGS